MCVVNDVCDGVGVYVFVCTNTQDTHTHTHTQGLAMQSFLHAVGNVGGNVAFFAGALGFAHVSRLYTHTQTQTHIHTHTYMCI